MGYNVTMSQVIFSGGVVTVPGTFQSPTITIYGNGCIGPSYGQVWGGMSRTLDGVKWSLFIAFAELGGLQISLTSERRRCAASILLDTRSTWIREQESCFSWCKNTERQSSIFNRILGFPSRLTLPWLRRQVWIILECNVTTAGGMHAVCLWKEDQFWGQNYVDRPAKNLCFAHTFLIVTYYYYLLLVRSCLEISCTRSQSTSISIYTSIGRITNVNNLFCHCHSHFILSLITG